MEKLQKKDLRLHEDTLDLQKIKSTNNIKQVNQLHNALTLLEKRCNQQIANKYLAGFLEEKGVNTYREYINSLT